MIYGINFLDNNTGSLQNKISKQNEINPELPIWLHLDANSKETKEFIEKELNHLDYHIKSALLAENTRPRYVEFENGFLLILRGINLNENQLPEDMVSLRIWVEKNRVITFQKRPLKTVLELKDLILNGNGPSNISQFIQKLIEILTNLMEPSFDQIIDQTDRFEELDLNKLTNKDNNNLSEVRKKCAIFSRYLIPQSHAIKELLNSNFHLINKLDKKKINETHHDILRRVEDILSIKERIQFVYDEYTNAISEKMNKTMYKIALISMFFIPISFLTGLLGTNLSGIPFANNSNSFVIFTIILLVLFISQLFIYKKLKWI